MSAEMPREGTTEITIDEFARLDIRVARVLASQKHPNAERLLVLRIDIGGEERQIVAGIAPYYTPDDLVGRLIVVVCNMKPAKLRGEESRGMLLAASGPDRVTVLTPSEDVPAGSIVS